MTTPGRTPMRAAPAKRLTCVVTSFGSAGDFLPTFAIACALHRAGHDVTFVSNPFYGPKPLAVGLRFLPAGEHVELFDRLEGHAQYGDTLRGPPVLFREFAAPDTIATYRVVRDRLAKGGVDVVVSSNVSPGGVWAALEAHVPVALVAASPISWIDGSSRMQFADRWIPPWALGLASAAVRAVVAEFIDLTYGPLAARLGVRIDEATLVGAERAVDLHLGMWSPHLREPVASDVPTRVVCGFAQAGHFGHPPELEPEVANFLAAGAAPVVIGLGSFFSLVAHEDLSQATQACKELGLRCLVVGYPSRTWSPPKGTLAVKYAPYNLVFPHARAVVTHGGAGSTAEALRAGHPLVVAPFGYDQFALAWQVERLGVGVRVPKRARDRAAWRRAFGSVTTDDTLSARAASVGYTFRNEPDGAQVACAAIENLFARA